MNVQQRAAELNSSAALSKRRIYEIFFYQIVLGSSFSLFNCFEYLFFWAFFGQSLVHLS